MYLRVRYRFHRHIKEYSCKGSFALIGTSIERKGRGGKEFLVVVDNTTAE